MKDKQDKFCKCGYFANKKHKSGPFFLTRAGDAKQNINLTWPYLPEGGGGGMEPYSVELFPAETGGGTAPNKK